MNKELIKMLDNEIKISIEFNNKGELAYIMKGSVADELEVNSEIKEKINKLVTKRDMANLLLDFNSELYSEIGKALQIAFENVVNKRYERYFKDETESEDKEE